MVTLGTLIYISLARPLPFPSPTKSLGPCTPQNCNFYYFENKTGKLRGLTHDFQGTTVTSPIGRLLPLDDTEYVETWIRCFEALARVKKLRDRRSEEEQNEITDIFLATAGLEAIQKFSTMAYPRNLEELNLKKKWRDNKKEYQTKENVSNR